MNPVRLAFGLLTALPVGRLPRVDRRSTALAMLLAPATTAPLLVLLWGGHAAASRGLSTMLLSAIVVTAAALYSRAMHLDGLADTADGLSSGHDPATSLRVMKQSDVGPSGVAAVVLALLLQVSALSVLLGSPGGTVLAGVALLVSRHTLAWSCRRGVPAAQHDGLGALVAGSVSTVASVSASLALALLSLAAGAGAPGAAPTATLWLATVLAATGGLGAALLLRRRCVRRLGGITGDVLGAGMETAFTVALVLAAGLLG